HGRTENRPQRHADRRGGEGPRQGRPKGHRGDAAGGCPGWCTDEPRRHAQPRALCRLARAGGGNVSTDPRRLKLVDLLRLLNSTPLGAVIQEHQLKNHRNRAGLRIGDSRRIDLVKYVAWLVTERHKPKAVKSTEIEDDGTLAVQALGAASLASWS